VPSPTERKYHRRCVACACYELGSRMFRIRVLKIHGCKELQASIQMLCQHPDLPSALPAPFEQSGRSIYICNETACVQNVAKKPMRYVAPFLKQFSPVNRQAVLTEITQKLSVIP
jgi:predicted RNA-binding protein YlxR (DUF448 family)